MAETNRRAFLEGLLVMILSISWPFGSEAQNPPAAAEVCPLDFTILNQYPSVANSVKDSANITLQCNQLNAGLETVISSYLKESNFFLVPNGTSAACINAYQSQLESQGVPGGFFNSTNCGPNPFFSERGADLCHNIQSAQDFQNAVPASQLSMLNSSCSGSLQKASDCAACNIAINIITVTLNGLPGSDNQSCTAFANIYAIAEVNGPGPRDPNTLLCLFYIESNHKSQNNLKYIGVGVGGMLFICIVGALIIFLKYKRDRKADREARKKRTKDLLSATTVPKSSINWFDIDELKKATGNFSRNNILGTGGYGNVYKGTLQDGSLVAVKRFKNCSPAGDKDFVHEVEMITSVKHRHLVEIKGCCVDSSTVHGHQRIIVYELMQNGSLHDHLFWKEGERDKPGRILLTWPMRKKIAIGMAKGLAYLHHDAVPAIFHRDIKAGNVLLDKDLNAKLGDFGLAKFTPDGVTHVTTRVAGTFGYIAPEYALYGQLTEKGDVYSFGMVILELVTGRKALSASTEDPPRTLLSDWAWPLVKQGRWRAIVDPRMGDNIGPDEEMERYILVGLLSAHPQVYYRPSIDQALKMLENGAFGVPTVPDRPLPFTSNRDEIRQALSQETLELQGRSRKTGYSSYSSSSASLEFSSKAPTSFSPERRESPDRIQDRSIQSPEAVTPLPSSLYNRMVSPGRTYVPLDRTQEINNESPDAAASHERISPNRISENVP